MNTIETKEPFRLLAQSRIPVVTGKTVDVAVFGTDPRDPDVIAWIHKDPKVEVDHALVRLHSACMTSEVLGSAKCDCAVQLNMAQSMISNSGWGVLVYLLRDEGRGIGLVNKIRAYALQDEGLDTVDANLALGFGADDRDFSPAVRALQLLDIRRLALLTNNPEKESALRSSGFDVVERIPMDVPITEHNRDYLVTKRHYFGHAPLHDPSTGFLTHETAAGVFSSEVNAARQNNMPLSAIALHIGQMEDWRKRHGHAMAERLATTIADVLKGSKHLIGMTVARMRPDCFLVLIRHVESAQARSIAEGLALALKTVRSPENGDSEPEVTFGVASQPAGSASLEVISNAMRSLPITTDSWEKYAAIDCSAESLA